MITRTYIQQRTEYAELTDDAKKLLDQLEDAITSHKQEAQSRNNWGKWGYNGDLEKANNDLAELLGFISGDDELADNGYQIFKERNA